MANPKKNPLIGAFRSPSPDDPPPTKPDEDKKPTEPPKEVKTPTTPAKPDTGKTPAELPKADGEKRPTETEKKAPEGKNPAALAKPGEDKKLTEPPKGGKEKKPVGGEGKAVESKTSTIPVKSAEGEKRGEDPGRDDEIPADFHVDIVSKDKLGSVTLIPLDNIDDFEGHPFPVLDDKDMTDLVASIKQVGILEPTTIIRNAKRPGRFEMVAGHRRKHAAQLAGLTHIPAIVRDMDHDAAIIYMVDSNLKREDVPLSVKARAYAMKLEAMKRKAGRRTNAEKAAMEAEGKKPLRADEELAKQTGQSRATIHRIVSVDRLEEPLKKMVDKKELPLDTAEQISQMKPEDQKVLANAIEKEGGKVPSKTEAVKLKEESKAGTLTTQRIEAAVAPTKREVDPPLKVTLTDEELRPYFPKGATLPDVKRVIFEALDLRKKAIEKQKAKAQAEKDTAKKKPPAPAR